MSDLQEWVGREEVRRAFIDDGPTRRSAAALDGLAAPVEPGTLPPLHHWYHFLDETPRAGTGSDGHAERGGFLPPVPLPRRMYVGGTFEFLAPIRTGETADKRSRVVSVNEKEGRSGRLVFVAVEHEVSQGGTVGLRERQDLVYRGPGERPPSAEADESDTERATVVESQRVTPDPVLLFRFSALTFNSHRIHYDRTYVTEEEGYSGLVVHGPLIAMLLLERARRERGDPPRFRFRAVNPVFDVAPFTVATLADEEKEVELAAFTPDGRTAMDATASYD